MGGERAEGVKRHATNEQHRCHPIIRRSFEASYQLMYEYGDTAAKAFVLSKLGATHCMLGDLDTAASHTVEIMFNLPPDFAGGGIANVPGILMKQSEQTRGVPLAGLAVKVMTGFFLIGLSSTEADMQRNIQLLKERAWFDIPVVYGNNRRAILALEKGTPGERAFAEAFAAWRQ